MSKPTTTIDDLYRFLYTNYRDHIVDGCVNVGSLTEALAVAFGGTPNPHLQEFVVDWCLGLQEAVAKEMERV